VQCISNRTARLYLLPTYKPLNNYHIVARKLTTYENFRNRKLALISVTAIGTFSLSPSVRFYAYMASLVTLTTTY